MTERQELQWEIYPASGIFQRMLNSRDNKHSKSCHKRYIDAKLQWVPPIYIFISIYDVEIFVAKIF